MDIPWTAQCPPSWSKGQLCSKLEITRPITRPIWYHKLSQTGPIWYHPNKPCTCPDNPLPLHLRSQWRHWNWFPCLLQYTFYSLGLPWAERHFGTFRHENIWKHVKYVETCENTQRRMKTRKHIQTHEKACENIFERMKRLVKTWKHVDTSLCELPVMATSYKKLLSHCSAL